MPKESQGTTYNNATSGLEELQLQSTVHPSNPSKADLPQTPDVAVGCTRYILCRTRSAITLQ